MFALAPPTSDQRFYFHFPNRARKRKKQKVQQNLPKRPIASRFADVFIFHKAFFAFRSAHGIIWILRFVTNDDLRQLKHIVPSRGREEEAEWQLDAISIAQWASPQSLHAQHFIMFELLKCPLGMFIKVANRHKTEIEKAKTAQKNKKEKPFDGEEKLFFALSRPTKKPWMKSWVGWKTCVNNFKLRHWQLKHKQWAKIINIFHYTFVRSGATGRAERSPRVEAIE